MVSLAIRITRKPLELLISSQFLSSWVWVGCLGDEELTAQKAVPTYSREC